jgi:hypothetical protein
MFHLRILVRFVSVLVLIIWVGGFTFYGAAVIPILHRMFDSAQAGRVTALATDVLNRVGGVTVGLWWLLVLLERASGARWYRLVRLGLLSTSTIMLGVLVWLHAVMDQHLAATGLARFYPLHRAYLIVSTVHWFVNVSIVWVSLALWDGTRQRPMPA